MLALDSQCAVAWSGARVALGMLHCVQLMAAVQASQPAQGWPGE